MIGQVGETGDSSWMSESWKGTVGLPRVLARARAGRGLGRGGRRKGQHGERDLDKGQRSGKMGQM